MQRRDLIPMAMLVLLLVGILIVGIARRSRIPDIWGGYPFSLDTLFMILYLVWMLVEGRISRKDADTEGKKTSDFATCQVYALSQALTLFTALWFSPVWREPNAAHLFGLVAFLIGVSYRLWAIRALGAFYSHRVRITRHHKIIDTGPYRFTRHPAYAGMLLAHAGLAIYFLNRPVVFSLLCALLPSVFLRIMVEEKMLFGIEGYSDFAKHRKRLFPGLW